VEQNSLQLLPWGRRWLHFMFDIPAPVMLVFALVRPMHHEAFGKILVF